MNGCVVSRTVKLALPILVGLSLLVLLPLHAWAAVTVTSFEAAWQGDKVVTSWATATELDNIGFNILRSDSASGTFTQINAKLIPTKCLGCVIGAAYSFADTSAKPGKTYYYKLQSLDASGSTQLFGPAVAAPPSQPSPTPTATRTRTRTNTPLPPASTATRTPTSPPTSTAIVLPTATRTPTLPRGATRAPSPTTARVEVGSPTSTPPQIALARKEPTPEEPEETAKGGMSTADSQSGDNARVQRLIFSSVMLLSGLLGFGALLCGVLAVYLFVRVSRR